MQHEAGSTESAADSESINGAAENAPDVSESAELCSDAPEDEIEFAEASSDAEFDAPSASADEPANGTAVGTGEEISEGHDGAAVDVSGLGSSSDVVPDSCPTETVTEFPDPGVLPPVELSGIHRGANRRAKRRPPLLALGFGIASVVLSSLCLLPVMVLRILPAVAGFVALVNGGLALAQRKSESSRRQVAFAGIGLLLGLIGIFAGPLWLNEAGERWRHAKTSRIVKDKLERIGTAISVVHDQQNRFPPGGSFVDSADGLPIGMHGWMTDLLPHLGYDELAAQIDRRRPWSDPANGLALSTRVDAYLTPGMPYELTATGHAPTHFAGVGGRVATEFGTGDLGIFGRNSQVTRDDVIDGLSQTMVAGEIAQTIPAWGEPDNWRSIGAGLNQSPQGFGNADDTGAHFLMADGSVRFLSNRTSLRTLQKLSTRNGSESESR